MSETSRSITTHTSQIHSVTSIHGVRSQHSTHNQWQSFVTLLSLTARKGKKGGTIAHFVRGKSAFQYLGQCQLRNIAGLYSRQQSDVEYGFGLQRHAPALPPLSRESLPCPSAPSHLI